MEFDTSRLFSKGFPTNRIPITIPSTGMKIYIRETTVVELKSMCKTIIDNLGRRQMDVIYDAATEYLQSMILTDGVDVNEFTEFDRLYCLMVFFQLGFFREPITYKCPHCGVDIVYRYDMAKYLQGMDGAYVGDQVVTMPHKSKLYEFTIGWPTVKDMSKLMNHFYNNLGVVTEDMERTQFGINFIFAFVKSIRVLNQIDSTLVCEIDMTSLDDFQERLDCIDEMPSMVMFDENEGVFSKVTGYFINRLENCFHSETCPQCHKETYYGLEHSSLFYGFFYGSLRSIYGFILQVECLCLFRYDCCIFDKEPYMTYNDLQSLVQQLGTTMEKDNKERQKIGKDNLSKGLWYIREILNMYIFPEDKMKH